MSLYTGMLWQFINLRRKTPSLQGGEDVKGIVTNYIIKNPLFPLLKGLEFSYTILTKCLFVLNSSS